MKVSDATYDVLNRIVKYLLPALGTFYFTLATIWNLPYAEQIVGTLAAIATVLAVGLALFKSNYEKEQKALAVPLEPEGGLDGDYTMSPEDRRDDESSLEEDPEYSTDIPNEVPYVPQHARE